MKSVKTLKVTALLASSFTLFLSGCSVEASSSSEEISSVSSNEETTTSSSDVSVSEPEDGWSEYSYTFKNLSANYTIEDSSLNTYYYEDSPLAYVEALQFLNATDGIFDMSAISSFISTDNSVYVIQNTRSYGIYSFAADWENDTITMSNFDFVNSLYPESDETPTYVSHQKVINTYKVGECPVTFDLGAYGYDIVYRNGELLLPYCVANLLFYSANLYNVYFNGEAYYGLSQGETSTLSEEDQNAFRTCSWNNTEASTAVRQMNVDFLIFAMDYFYGLKDYKGIDTFADVITGDLLDELMSSDPAVNADGYIDFIYQTLDEGHSSLSMPSFYNNATDYSFTISAEDLGPWNTQFSSNLNTLYYSLIASIAETYTNDEGETQYSIPPIRFEGNTAILLSTGFALGSTDQIYNEDGTMIEDAYNYDTYYFFKHGFEQIEAYETENNTQIENVILDFSVNTGGAIISMIDTLGFLSDDPVMYTTTNQISGETGTAYYRIDANDDGDYTDNDSYANDYNFYVLTSPVSFSCGNLFPSIVKNMGSATLIGETSGGGTCSVLTLVMPDGTTFNTSSASLSLASPVYQDGILTGSELIEDGITPDIAVSSENFYNDEYLVNLINNN